MSAFTDSIVAKTAVPLLTVGGAPLLGDDMSFSLGVASEPFVLAAEPRGREGGGGGVVTPSSKLALDV